MPKQVKPSKKPVEDDVETSEKQDESDMFVTETETEEPEAIDDEDIEETTSSDDNDEVYTESDSDEEKDLKDGDIKEEQDCEYELDEQVQTYNEPRKERKHRTTRPVLTYYEKVQVLSVRASQIAVGAKVFVSGAEDRNPLDIAKLELEQGLIPFVIIRSFPDNTFERWKLSELVLNDLYKQQL